MSPTIFREGRFRFFFFSLEEERKHVHISSPDGEAKYWLEPSVELAGYSGLDSRQLNLLKKIIENRKDEIITNWQEHFKA